jgi:hypothetical protein
VATFLGLCFGVHLAFPWPIIGGVGAIVFGRLVFSGNVRVTIATLAGTGVFTSLYFGTTVGLWTALAGGVGAIVASNLILRKRRHFHSAPPKETIQAEPAAVDPPVTDTEDPLSLAWSKHASLLEAAGKIKLPAVKMKLEAVADVVHRILADLSAQPKHLQKARQFLNYYLDATVKIVQRYVSLSSKGSKDKTLNDALRRTEETIETLQKAFEKQLRLLLEDDMLDLDTELTVLRRTIEMEGLGKGLGE